MTSLPDLPVPTIVRRAALALSLLTLATSIPLAAAAGLLPQIKPGEPRLLALMGFEIVVTVAAILGVLFGLGRYAAGPAVALACVSGTILLGSALGWLGANRNIAGVTLTPLLALRVLIALALAAAGGLIVLRRAPGSFALLFKGLAALAPLVLAAGAFAHSPTRIAIGNAVTGGTVVTFAIAVFGFLIGGVLLAIGGHCVIRAFELGRIPDQPTSGQQPAPNPSPQNPPQAAHKA